jgi:hypothetical protein
MQHTVEILKQTPYNYGFLASSATAEICLVRALDVSWARTVGLSVRVHRVNIASTGSPKFELILGGTNPSPSDGTDFLTELATSDPIQNGTAVGSLITLTTGLVLTDVVHPYLRVVLKATGPSGAAGNLYAELSATLVLRAP